MHEPKLEEQLLTLMEQRHYSPLSHHLLENVTREMKWSLGSPLLLQQKTVEEYFTLLLL